MTARQNQGFRFESCIAGNLKDFMLSESYTSEYDGLFYDMPVSVKSMKSHADICLSDFHRIINNTTPSIMMLEIRESRSQHLLYILSFPKGTQALFAPHIIQATELVSDFADYMRKDVLMLAHMMLNGHSIESSS